MESKAVGWAPCEKFADITQPPRTKATIVGQEYGKPYLAATQAFEFRPFPRKWLAVGKIDHAETLYVKSGDILVSRSGTVGRATLAFAPHKDTLISDDLLRVQPRTDIRWGWLYAYLRAPKVRAMMRSARYGHIIKHLEVDHLNALPILNVHEKWLKHFKERVGEIIKLRDRAYITTLNAEEHFEKCVGPLNITETGENGFVIQTSKELFSKGRRLDATRHNPIARKILKHLSAGKRRTETIVDCGYRVWVPGRYKRIPAEDGVQFIDSADLFEINPDISKRFADCKFGDEYRGRVQSNWLLLASSGQTYGLVGGVVMGNEFYNDKVLANHVIRIAPEPSATVRPGYLLATLTHPILGRPIVKSFTFGSSVPELAPSDIESFLVVRLKKEDEDYIADSIEEAAQLRARADLLENSVGTEAENILDRFIAGAKADIGPI